MHKYAFLCFTYLLQSAAPEHSVFLLKSWLWSFSDKGLTDMFAGRQKPKMGCYWFVCERLFPQCFHPTLCYPTRYRAEVHRLCSKGETLGGLSQENQHAKGNWPQKPKLLAGYQSGMFKLQQRERNLCSLILNVHCFHLSTHEIKKKGISDFTFRAFTKGVFCYYSLKDCLRNINAEVWVPLKMTWNNDVC